VARDQSDDCLVDQVRSDPDAAPLSPKMHALLRIAGAVQRGGKNVRDEDVAAARQAGATDLEIRDTVLIAAMFALANRYVDGLATTLPEDPATYGQLADFPTRRSSIRIAIKHSPRGHTNITGTAAAQSHQSRSSCSGGRGRLGGCAVLAGPRAVPRARPMPWARASSRTWPEILSW
jgi:hypothetical protein